MMRSKLNGDKYMGRCDGCEIAKTEKRKTKWKQKCRHVLCELYFLS